MVLSFIPNEADATNANQAEPDSVDFDILAQVLSSNYAPTGVVTGCAVTESSTPAQTVDIAAGQVRIGGRPVTVSAQANKAVSAADGTNPRFDLITINTSGTAVVTAGTPAAEPVLPAVPADSAVLAALYVAASDNTHNNNQITDKRVQVPLATFFHPKWYGAVGDGATDDTTAFQACATDADTAKGTIWLGPYLYKTTSTTTIIESTSIVGENSESSGFVFTTASAGFCIKVDGNGNAAFVGKGQLARFRVNHNASGNSGLLLEDTYGYRVSDVETYGGDVGAYGIAMRYGDAGSAYNYFSNCIVRDAATAGFHIDGDSVAKWANRSFFKGCWAMSCSGTGLLITDGNSNSIEIRTENNATGVDLGNAGRTILDQHSEGDTTGLDMGSGAGHRIFYSAGAGPNIDIGTTTNTLLMGRWNGDDEVGEFYNGSNTIIHHSSGIAEPYIVAADEFLSQDSYQHSRYWLTDTWPTAGGRAVAYVDFGDQEFQGAIEIEVSGYWNTGQANGIIRRAYAFEHAVDTTDLTGYQSDVLAVTGPISAVYSVGDAEIHTTDMFRIPIYRLDATSTSRVVVKVTVYYPNSAAKEAAKNILDGVTFVQPVNAANTEVANFVTVEDGKKLYSEAVETAGALTLDWSHSVVNVDTSGGAVTITLPDNATYDGKSYLVHRDGASNVTINRAGTDTFDDAATSKTLGSDGAGIGVFSIGDGEWKIVATSGTVT